MKYFEHALLKENSIEYREYQDKISEKVLKHNTLVVLPTGTGKTIIALLTSVKWLGKNMDAKIYFLAPTRPLVNQHFNLFRKYLRQDTLSLAVLTGVNKPNSRQLLWKNRIIFATPQLMYNDLVREYVNVKSNDLIILDEAHRAVGEHSYVKIIKLLDTRNIHPRILALTASPGGTDKTLTIMKNLKLKNIEIHTHEDPIISRYFHGYTVSPIFVTIDPVHKHMIKLLLSTLDNYIDRINSIIQKFGYKISKSRLSYTYLKGMKDEIIETHYSVVKDNELKIIKKLFYEIIYLERILTYLETYTYKTAKKLLDEIFGSDTKIKRRGLSLYYNRELREVYHLLSRALDKKVFNKKTEKLLEIIKKRDFTKALIFTSLKDNAVELYEIIKGRDHKVGILIGQTRGKGVIGMKQVQQLKTLDDFNKGVTRILIATHVGEEGLDISEVDLVIFFDNPISAIRRIQRMGRTGRRKKGRVLFLINKDTREEVKYYVSTKKYKKLISELKELKNILEEESSKKSLEDYISVNIGFENRDFGEGYIVYIDAREKSSIINILSTRGIPVKIENLDVGDFIVGDYIIERKTIHDLAKSIFDGRIFSQLKSLSNIGKGKLIFLIEGKKIDFLKYSTLKAFLGVVYTIIFDFNIPIYFSENEEETAELISYLYFKSVERKKKTERVRYEKKPRDIHEIQKHVLSGIPGIDNKLAERLLERFGSLKNIANATPTRLMEVKGVGNELAMRIYKVFNYIEKKS